MNKPEVHLQLVIDKLLQSSYNFALYRLPWTDEPILVFQKDTEITKLDSLKELNNKKGFVFAPFCPTAEHPVLLINADLHIHGWNNMMQSLSEFFPTERVDEIKQISSSDDGLSTKPATEDERKICYNDAFKRFINPLESGLFEKLVLSRSASYQLEEGFSPLEAFITACNSYPRMLVTLCHTAVSGTWVGSTPEIILNGQHPYWQTVALAGTMPMNGDEVPTDWSPKNQREQEIVTEYIQHVLKTFKSKATLKGPYTARAGHLVHLKTDFQFKLKKADLLGDLLDALHPTPAVCGLPKKEAYQFILDNEGYDRSYYSGIVGWLDPEDITHLYVNLRCMHITEKATTLYAGGGILPSSTAESEWEETQIKMNTMRKCLC